MSDITIKTGDTAVFTLIDEVTGKEIRVRASIDDGRGIAIEPEGYSNAYGNECVRLEYYDCTDTNDDPLRVIVWGDIDEEDATNIISLKGAKNISIEKL